MTCDDILQSLSEPEHDSVGVTAGLKARVKSHDAGDLSHTSKFAPWRIKTSIAFSEKQPAFAFERYLESASGRAFAKKRL